MATLKTFVGRYTESDLRSGKDKKEIEEAKKKCGLKYVISEHVLQKGKIVAIDVFLSNTF